MISPCLFIDIDTQNDFFEKSGAMPIKNAEEIRNNLKLLTRHAQKKGINIISSLETRRQDSSIQKKLHSYCVPGSKGHEKIKETLLRNHFLISSKDKAPNYRILLKKYGQLLFEKSNFNFFSNRHIMPLLRKSKIINCIVYGVAIDYGAETVILKLLKAGFKVWIPVDAVKPINEDNREPVMKELRSKGAEMWNTEFIIKNT